ncbi:MAG: hypothetical protein Q4D76_07930 [Oscillospiraceae bacterium]|nr:hypothetical protein [Oscillospiraceae bacterium]
MTAIQEQAIQLIQQLPDEKIQAIITLASDEINLINLQNTENSIRKKKALQTLENLNLIFPEEFDAEKELREAMEDKYGITY